MFARSFLHPNPLPRVMRASGLLGWSRANNRALGSVTH